MRNGQRASTLTIEEQHGAIIACCDELLAAMASASAIGEVGQVRMRLAGLLHANLASEEALLIGPIRRLAPSSRPLRFAELSDEAAELRGRYSEHVGQWTLMAIGEDRVAYARAATELVREVKAHLKSKQAVLVDWRRAAAQESGRSVR